MGDILSGRLLEERGTSDALRLQAQMKSLQEESVRSSARLAGLASRTVTQTRARPGSGMRGTAGGTGGGLANAGGQAQRTGGIQGGKVGGPLGHRGPAAGTSATKPGAGA